MLRRSLLNERFHVFPPMEKMARFGQMNEKFIVLVKNEVKNGCEKAYDFFT